MCGVRIEMRLEVCKYGEYYWLNNSRIYVKKEHIAPLYDILTYEYPYILDRMLFDEFYIIQDREYDFVKEIVCEEKVVGFSALNYYNDSLIMELCYILPSYRNKGLFANEINILKEEFCEELWLDLPNRFAIESLIYNGLAVKINDFIVKSEVLLSFRHPIFDNVRLSTDIYDLRVCGSVDLNFYYLSPLLDVDIFCFDADKGRDRFVDEFYFKKFEGIMMNKENVYI